MARGPGDVAHSGPKIKYLSALPPPPMMEMIFMRMPSFSSPDELNAEIFFCLAKQTACAIESREHQLLPRDDVAAVLGPRLGRGRGWGEARGRAEPGGVQAPLLGLGVAEPAPARQLFRTDVSFPRERESGG